jgi:glycogen operon protein
MRYAVVVVALFGCASPVPSNVDARASALDAAVVFAPPLGATISPGGDEIAFRVHAPDATRVELSLFDVALGAEPTRTVTLDREQDPAIWAARVARDGGATVYYGYRIWGPNWDYDASWIPGSTAGFVTDIDDDGHRFNPNKLLIDPYAREISHDPTNANHTDYDVYRANGDHRERDSGPFAPKGIVVEQLGASTVAAPDLPLRDAIIYEVHPRGFTRTDPTVTAACRGTYAGAAEKAAYIADLGISAIELLPVHETNNDANDNYESAGGDNYWGYSTLAFFAPDRRYACDQSPGGPTREFRAMVDAFHAAGVAVFLDVVYNHTGEGGGSALLSLKGFDNPGYYELDDDPTRYVSNTGAGPNTNAASEPFRDLVLDSLHYWADEMGVDGFRFDLASVLGNSCDRDCFAWDADDPDGILRRAVAELPDAALIAEPWGIGQGTYRIGQFPEGWAEWNDHYRDLIRQDQNRLDVDDVTPGWLANRITGSPDLFGDDGRGPSASINYIVSHDGFTLRDLYSCNDKVNDQPWPFGPSDGGHDDNISWDHGGDEARQRQAARNGIALLMLSQGVPMITGGDEMFRTQYCNNNPYNLDSSKNWLDWSLPDARPAFAIFARRMIRFRRDHPALRNSHYLDDEVSWHKADGTSSAGAAYMDDPSNQFLAWRLDGVGLGDPARTLYIAYNGGSPIVQMTLPEPADGFAWYRVADTAAWMEAFDNIDPPGDEYRMNQRIYDVAGRSVVVFIER